MSQHVLSDQQALRQQIATTPAEKIFLVTGKNSFVASGAKSFLASLFLAEKAGVFSDFKANPHLEDVEKGIVLFHEKEYELIIAIGGGSVMDMAKLISVFAHQSGDIRDYVHKKRDVTPTKTPLIAIPTTSGSGAEATHFSVLYVDKKKYSVAAPSFLPDHVFLTSQFSMTASSYLTACTGVDALAQAIEAFWSVNSTQQSEAFALQAISHIWKNLHEAVHHNCPKAKAALSKGAYLAGSAINITKTTAPHAFSYAFTSYYAIPHGHAVALSLPYFFAYNYAVCEEDCEDKRGAIFVQNQLIKLADLLAIDIEKAKEELTIYINALRLDISIATLIPDFNPNYLKENINVERLGNNPRRVTTQTVLDFLAQKM